MINVGQPGSRASVGIPGTGMSWNFGGHRPLHRVVQAQADVKAVHAQGTLKAVQAQADIIAITKRMEIVAKRLMCSVAGGTHWKKAAIEQAQLLDKMLDIAKAGENDELIAAVKKCHNAWADGNPHYRAALDSGMTIVDCLGMVLAGKQPDLNLPANLTSDPVTATNNVREPAANECSANRRQLVLEQANIKPPIEEAAFWPGFWNTLGRNLVLPVIGCGVISVVYIVATRKTTSYPSVIESATSASTPEKPAATAASQRLAAAPAPEGWAATPAPQLSTPTPPPVDMTPTPSQDKQMIHGKVVHNKRPTHNSTHRPER